MVMNERISRLMDGEIDAAELDGVCAMLKGDAAMVTWSCYHTIGDALRGETPVTRSVGMEVSRQLVAEPTVLAPRMSAASRTASWAWAAAASIAAVTVVGWAAYSLIDATPAGLAKAGEAETMRAAQICTLTCRRIICSRTMSTRRPTPCRAWDRTCGTSRSRARCVRRWRSDRLAFR